MVYNRIKLVMLMEGLPESINGHNKIQQTNTDVETGSNLQKHPEEYNVEYNVNITYNVKRRAEYSQRNGT